MSKLVNRFRIWRGFNKLKKCERSACLEGIRAIAKAGLEYLAEAHERHKAGMLHTLEYNTMAYAIGHNGKVLESGFYKGENLELFGSADEKAVKLISGTEGYVAVIYSDMLFKWYRLDYEIDFLLYSIDHIKANFDKFFKPIS